MRRVGAACAVAVAFAAVVSIPAVLGGTDVAGTAELARTPRDGIEAFFVGGPTRSQGSRAQADERFSALAADATRSIDLAAYTLGRDSVVGALLDAFRRRVSVRVVVDESPDAGGAPGWVPLRDEGIPIHTDTVSRLHHNKFAVFDSAVTWTGSANFTDSGFANESNNVLVVTSTEVADIYSSQFDEMHENARFGCSDTPGDCSEVSVRGTLIEIAFGPCGCMRLQVEAAIASADVSLYVAMNRFTDRQLASALIGRHESGVHVVMIMSDQGFDLDESIVTMLQLHGIAVLEESWPGRPYLHDKFAVVDAGTLSDPLVITGSANWSVNGMERNDENSLVIHSGRIAQQYCHRFEDIALTAHPDIGVRCDSSLWLPSVAR